MASLSSLKKRAVPARLTEQDGAHDPECDRSEIDAERSEAVEGRKGDFAEQYRVAVQVHITRQAGYQDYGNRKKGWEHQTDCRVLAHEASATDCFDQHDGEQANQGGARNENRGA